MRALTRGRRRARLRAGRRPRPRRDDESPDPRSNRFGRLALHGVGRRARRVRADARAGRRSDGDRARSGLFHGRRRRDGAERSVRIGRIPPARAPRSRRRPSDARAAADALACPDADGRSLTPPGRRPARARCRAGLRRLRRVPHRPALRVPPRARAPAPHRRPNSGGSPRDRDRTRSSERCRREFRRRRAFA